ncbi:MAG: hypothetical protein SGJ27_16020 [Candidatus Melainabacteria bacterium]|nr:hypothetical protein [Candidatus Melainabacteria bacterium]
MEFGLIETNSDRYDSSRKQNNPQWDVFDVDKNQLDRLREAMRRMENNAGTSDQSKPNGTRVSEPGAAEIKPPASAPTKPTETNSTPPKPVVVTIPEKPKSSNTAQKSAPIDSTVGLSHLPLPDTTDLAAFESNSGFFQRNYTRENLIDMAQSSDVHVQKMSNYLIENFDAVSQLTSGGKKGNLGINDVRLLAVANDAIQNVKSLVTKTVPAVLNNWDDYDSNGNGYVSKFEFNYANRDKPESKALAANYDFLKNQTDEGNWLDRGISKADLQAVQADTALKSVLRDAHKNEDLEVRAYYARIVGRAIGVGAVVLADPENNWSRRRQMSVIEGTGRLTGGAVSWYFSDDADKHFNTIAEPALSKIFRTQS